jgi:hypothetical protein
VMALPRRCWSWRCRGDIGRSVMSLWSHIGDGVVPLSSVAGDGVVES